MKAKSCKNRFTVVSPSQTTRYKLAKAKDCGSHHSYKSDRPISLMPGVS